MPEIFCNKNRRRVCRRTAEIHVTCTGLPPRPPLPPLPCSFLAALHMHQEHCYPRTFALFPLPELFPLRCPDILPIWNKKPSPHLVLPYQPDVFFSSALIIIWCYWYLLTDWLSSPMQGGAKKVSRLCVSPAPRTAHTGFQYLSPEGWINVPPYIAATANQRDSASSFS